MSTRAGTSNIHAGVNSAALRSNLASNSVRRQGIEDHSSEPLDAVIGFRNGVIGGIALWLLAYLLFSLVGSFA